MRFSAITQQKGFTIIEMIIVIFIISVAMVGIYSAFSIIIVLNADLIDRLQAAYLSQEGIEIVRNIRDENWLSGSADPDAWLFGLADQNTNCAQGCQADYTTDPLNSKPLIPYIGNPLYINPNGFYCDPNVNGTCVNGKQTKFSRKITITSFPAGEVTGSEPNTAIGVLKIVVDTYWYQKPNILNPAGSQQSMEAEEVLYNWY